MILAHLPDTDVRLTLAAFCMSGTLQAIWVWRGGVCAGNHRGLGEAVWQARQEVRGRSSRDGYDVILCVGLALCNKTKSKKQKTALINVGHGQPN